MLKKYLVLLFVCSCMASQATVIYVKSNASGANSGTSWADAFTTIQDGISASAFGDTIWVAAAMYKPAVSSRSLSFNLKSGVSMFGGFNGTETQLSQRNFTTNITTLSGDIGSGGVASDNSYHVVTAYNFNFPATLDGFRVMDGNANFGDPYGGGLDIDGGKVNVRNCTFTNNSTTSNGGAIYMLSGALVIENCIFQFNTSVGSGGAVSTLNGDLRVVDCVFTGNESISGGGGGLDHGGDALVVDRCIFSANICDVKGSAIQCFGAFQHDTIMNSLFVGNVSYYGSALELETTPNFGGTCSINLINCTVAHNSSLISASSSYYVSAVTFDNENYPKNVYNTIIWGNRAWAAAEGSFDYFANNVTDIPNYTTNNNITGDPLFVNPGTASAAPFFASAYDYHLSTMSDAIDNGLNGLLPARYMFDLDSFNRKQGSFTDRGCYERSYCLATPEITFTGDSTFCWGKSTTLTAPAGLKYKWNTGDTTQNITVSAAGKYSVYMIDTAQCRGVDTQAVSITVDTLNIHVAGSDTFCPGNKTILVAPQAVSYIWSNNSTNDSITVTTGGSYTVTVTDTSGCKSVAMQKVVAVNAPFPVTINTPNGTTTCLGKSLPLTVTAAGNVYAWSNGSTDSAITVSTSNTYRVTVTDANHCTGTSGAVITFSSQKIAVNAFPDSSVCQGDTITLSVTGNAQGYLWSNGGTTTSIQVTGTNTYYVSVTQSDSCLAVGSKKISVRTPQNMVIGYAGAYTLSVSSSFTSLQWYLNGSAISGATQNTHVVTASGTYTATGLDAFGCATTAAGLSVTFSDVENITPERLFYFDLASSTLQFRTDLADTYTLIDLSGRQIAELKNPQGSIDLGYLSTGHYFIKGIRTGGSVYRFFKK